MREPYTQLYLHLVWATWDRLPLLTPEIKDRVYQCLKDECHAAKVEVIAVGGVEDHVHLLVRFPATLAISTLVKQIKGVSSHLVTHQLAPKSGFKWQGGYGAFTMAKRDVKMVRNYINNQEEHHRNNKLSPSLERDSE